MPATSPLSPSRRSPGPTMRAARWRRATTSTSASRSSPRPSRARSPCWPGVPSRSSGDAMRAFTRLTAVAAPIDLPNVDTDRIIPARFLRKPRSADYARFLFHDVRFEADGSEKPEFVLNQPPYRSAQIIVAAENFGCGSSREMAVWALAAFGIRAVIAPSLGDIFHQNCFKNGLLPVILPATDTASLRRQLHERPGATIDVDLEAQTVTAPDGSVHRFDVDPFRKQMLLTGQDEIALTLRHETEIRAFEARHAREMPWLVAE